MAMFVTVDQTNRVTGLYTDAPGYTAPPAGAIQVSAADGEALRRGFSGYKLAGGSIVAIGKSSAEVWAEIKERRDYLSEQGGYKVVVAGVDKWFHSDQKSRSQQLGLVLLGANIPAGLQWKTMDGTFVTMTQTLAAQILAAAAASDMAIFTAAETHKAAMEASADPAAYDYSTGWPATFLG